MSDANSPAMIALKAEWAAFRAGGEMSRSAESGSLRQREERARFLSRVHAREEATREFFSQVKTVSARLLDVKRCVWAVVPRDFGWRIQVDELAWTIYYWPLCRPNRVRQFSDPSFDLALSFLREVDWEVQRRLAKASAVGKKRGAA